MKGGINMCDDANNSCGCLQEILRKILMLQRQDFDNENYAGCDKPYLGPICTPICYNTRPITLYNCATGTNWSFPYTLNGTTGESNVFRIEAIDECCCTCRVLALNENNQYVSTSDFFTIDLGCVGAIKCLPDIFVDLC